MKGHDLSNAERVLMEIQKAGDRNGAATATRQMVVRNRCGLHARPAAMFVRLARTFQCEISIERDGRRFDATRILDLLMANLDCGAGFTLIAVGTDADKAVESLQQLLDGIPVEE